MAKAVIVVDMQNICVGDAHAKFFKYNNKELIAAVNKVIKDNEGNSIFYILNIMKVNLINRLAPFKAFEGSENVELVNSLEVVSNYIFKKYKGDAFTNPKLKEKLDELSIDEISKKLGYNYSSNFVKMFKKTHGKTPLAFRKLKI